MCAKARGRLEACVCGPRGAVRKGEGAARGVTRDVPFEPCLGPGAAPVPVDARVQPAAPPPLVCVFRRLVNLGRLLIQRKLVKVEALCVGARAAGARNSRTRRVPGHGLQHGRSVSCRSACRQQAAANSGGNINTNANDTRRSFVAMRRRPRICHVLLKAAASRISRGHPRARAPACASRACPPARQHGP